MNLNKIISERFPRRRINMPCPLLEGGFASGLIAELDRWLMTRSGWSHDEWLGLLDDLHNKGFATITDLPEGQAHIGRYLEEHKRQS